MDKKLKKFYLDYIIDILKKYPNKWEFIISNNIYDHYDYYSFNNDNLKIDINYYDKSIHIYFLKERKNMITVPIMMDFYLNFKFIKYYKLMKKTINKNKINEQINDFINYTGEQRTFKLNRILKKLKNE